jgi:hypothetical protein
LFSHSRLVLFELRLIVTAAAPMATAAPATAGPVRAVLAAGATTATAAATPAWSPAHVDIGGPTRGTRRGGSLLGVGDPSFLTGETAQLPWLHAILTTADDDRLAADEGVRHLASSALENASHGLSRDAHHLGRLLVTQALEINETYGL